jgi:predicted Rossmann fold nucleotide-binding protein DprA/Smf involved in DNA uptake
MAKNDSDLFDRLRNAGLRKQAAKTLSGMGEDAGKKAVKAARNAVKELRTLADEIESRLPKLTQAASAPARRARSAAGRSAAGRSTAARSTAARSTTARSTTARSTTARAPSTRAKSSGRRAAGGGTTRRAARPASTRKATPARSSAASSGGARAPRGANKAKILASLRSGPKTASEIAKQTGIGVGTVGSTLTKMAGSGEVQKAARGYSLPS